ncbi:glycoside hydrolase family 36 protein [Glycomyces buryatensis]|uniref:Alpha-galactosidase n=1 Tax=Glycomyces buryatensis TaxID=2570927 RepID=A0A4S8Q014_9ACTN|nr:glycoside hydrolase family 36 protein [Glycomyces buryatensis]THV33889.1 alpha-galactosidase [Glycomyces buryatensis]
MILRWSTGDLLFEFTVGPDVPVTLDSLLPAACAPYGLDLIPDPDPGRIDTPPLVEVQALGHGRFPGSHRYSSTVLGSRLRYTSHETVDGALHLHQTDDVTDLRVTSVISPQGRVVRAWTVLRAGSAPVTVQAVTSLVIGTFVTDSSVGVDELDVLWGDSDWVAESRWRRSPLREVGLPAMDPAVHHHMNRARMAVTTRSSWSTGERLPTGLIVERGGGYGLGFQIEHNGAWHWEIGEDRTGASLALLGPTDAEHQWSTTLARGEAFESVPVAVTVADAPNPVDAVLAELTWYRRALVARTGTAGHERPLPVIFNDYMNTLMGDPTTAKILPLAEAAARAGSDYYCIDAGWYDDAGGWWDAVGEWEPSASRFPGGLAEVLDHIRGLDMVPGIWLEPEVIGVRSPLAERLPEDAFFQRGGQRVVEHGRYHLDMRHPAAVAHLDSVVDRLIGMGVGYFKLDYNIMPGPGTDAGGLAPGAGLLEHCRAYLSWLDGVLARHPGLLIENCASGGMRADYATLSRLHIQSTSDQQNPLLYPPIAAATPASILPEQAGHWGYAQPEMSWEESAFTLTAGITGRLYLSGHLATMDEEQLSLVASGVAAHRELLPFSATAVPSWPLGLDHRGPWQTFGLNRDETTVLTVWRLPGAPDALELPLPALRGRELDCRQLFPAPETGGIGAWDVAWDAASGVLRVETDVPAPTARILRLHGPADRAPKDQQ